MIAMAKKQSKRSGEQKPRERKGLNLNFWLTPKMGEALLAYCKAQKHKTQKTAVARDAIELWLREEGFWPPPENPE